MVLLLGWSTPTTTKYTIDPSAPGTIVRILFGAEAVLNLLLGVWVIFDPKTALTYMVTKPSSQITPAAETLTRYIGLVFIIITTPLLLGLPQTPRGVMARGFSWAMYAGAEVCMFVLFFGLVSLGEKETGFRNDSIQWLGQQLILPFVIRTFTLFFKPQWLGRVVIEDDGRKGL